MRTIFLGFLLCLGAQAAKQIPKISCEIHPDAQVPNTVGWVNCKGQVGSSDDAGLTKHREVQIVITQQQKNQLDSMFRAFVNQFRQAESVAPIP